VILPELGCHAKAGRRDGLEVEGDVSLMSGYFVLVPPL